MKPITNGKGFCELTVALIRIVVHGSAYVHPCLRPCHVTQSATVDDVRHGGRVYSDRIRI